MPKPAYRGFRASLLRAKREERGWTQEQLATLIAVYPTMVGQWENGRHVPNVATINRLAAVFGLRPQDFTEALVEEADLADLRLWAGLSREQAHRRTGISARRLRWYEHGTREPDPQAVTAMAAGYDVDERVVREAWARVRDRDRAEPS